MVKLYNTQANLASDLSNFFKNVVPDISKPHLKIVPYIILGMVQSESVVTPDIVKTFKGDFSFVSPFSSIRRLERFFNNPNFNVYISFDHMFCRDSFTIFLISLRIGKQRHSSLVSLFQRQQQSQRFLFISYYSRHLFCSWFI